MLRSIKPIFFLSLFLRLSALFLVLFWIGRIGFLALNSSSVSLMLFVDVFRNACRIDVSSLAYLLAVPFLLSVLQTIFRHAIWVKLFRAFVGFVVLYISILLATDVCLYQEWGSKINARVFLYLQHPSEIFSSASDTHYLVFFGLLSLLLFVAYWLYKRLRIDDSFQTPAKKISLLLTPLWAAFLVLCIRGGWQEIPMQESDSYFSKDQKVNDATVNTFWNFTASVIRQWSSRGANPYNYFKEDELSQFASDTFDTAHDVSILKVAKPNIVFIILEGWSADLVGSVSGDAGHSASPMFDELSKEGILFTQCYASGDRSDQGLTAILTSFPALPNGSVINESPKIKALPAISSSLKKAGYTNLFLFGGDLSYGNLKALIYQKHFDTIIEEKDIDPALYRGRLGVHDEHTFELLNQKLNVMRAPFFASFFTQSTHFHYDYPRTKTTITWAGEQNAYANSMLYSDSCIGDFFRKAKHEKWYDNTLFVIVPDHSHHSPKTQNPKSVDYHHIPLLLYGNVLSDSMKGKQISYPVSQCDVAPTVLHQTGLPVKVFTWGKNLFTNTEQARAFFVYTEGVGCIRNTNCKVSYDAKNNRIEEVDASSCDQTILVNETKSYLQKLYETYLKY